MRNTLVQYMEILRPGHWFKNLVVLVGAAAASVYFRIDVFQPAVILKVVIAFILTCLVSSINYAVNNLTDEKGDAVHPLKKNRALPQNRIAKRYVYGGIAVLTITVFLVSFLVFGVHTSLALFSLFCAGVIYNIKPIRFKDVPVFDVVTESVNNPIRILIGWLAVVNEFIFPPITLLTLFWAAGGALMAAKRYNELQYFKDIRQMKALLRYRRSFRFYSLKGLYNLVLAGIIVSVGMYLLFAMKIRTGLVLLTPLIVLFFIWFMILLEGKGYMFREPENIFLKKPYFSLFAFFIFSLLIFIILFYK